jgi:hypothetical protein
VIHNVLCGRQCRLFRKAHTASTLRPRLPALEHFRPEAGAPERRVHRNEADGALVRSAGGTHYERPAQDRSKKRGQEADQGEYAQQNYCQDFDISHLRLLNHDLATCTFNSNWDARSLSLLAWKLVEERGKTTATVWAGIIQLPRP